MRITTAGPSPRPGDSSFSLSPLVAEQNLGDVPRRKAAKREKGDTYLMGKTRANYREDTDPRGTPSVFQVDRLLGAGAVDRTQWVSPVSFLPGVPELLGTEWSSVLQRWGLFMIQRRLNLSLATMVNPFPCKVTSMGWNETSRGVFCGGSGRGWKEGGPFQS